MNSCLNATTNVEKLEVDKTDTEVIIQELHDTAKRLEEMRDNETNSIVKIKLKSFITELNKEIEWNEQILQELNDSINFIVTRGND